MSELKEEKKVIKQPKTVKENKPNYTFIKPYLTSEKEYKVGDGIYLTNKKTIEFLLTKKIIK